MPRNQKNDPFLHNNGQSHLILLDLNPNGWQGDLFDVKDLSLMSITILYLTSCSGSWCLANLLDSWAWRQAKPDDIAHLAIVLCVMFVFFVLKIGRFCLNNKHHTPSILLGIILEQALTGKGRQMCLHFRVGYVTAMLPSWIGLSWHFGLEVIEFNDAVSQNHFWGFYSTHPTKMLFGFGGNRPAIHTKTLEQCNGPNHLLQLKINIMKKNSKYLICKWGHWVLNDLIIFWKYSL